MRDVQEGKGKGCAREGFSLQIQTPEHGGLCGKQASRTALAAYPAWSSSLQLFVHCTRAFWAVCTLTGCYWEGAILFSIPFTTLNFRPLGLIQLYLSHLISWFLFFLLVVILFFFESVYLNHRKKVLNRKWKEHLFEIFGLT